MKWKCIMVMDRAVNGYIFMKPFESIPKYLECGTESNQTNVWSVCTACINTDLYTLATRLYNACWTSSDGSPTTALKTGATSDAGSDSLSMDTSSFNSGEACTLPLARLCSKYTGLSASIQDLSASAS
jgi:hypothetical protein